MLAERCNCSNIRCDPCASLPTRPRCRIDNCREAPAGRLSSCLQMTLRSRSWDRANTYAYSAFPPDRLAAERGFTVSVCLPARNEARTIGPILEQLLPLRERGVVDQIVVVDRSS